MHEDILYIEGGKDYITIFTKNAKVLSLASLTKIHQNLPLSQFLRIHKSFVVAVDKIESIERQRVIINKEYLPIGDTYKDDLSKIIKGI